jgi:RNA polymerase sigma-70 factor (ECF subfamily)
MDIAIQVLENEMALVKRAVAEPAAFAEIYDYYFPRVYNYIRYRVRNAETADDITAVVFERALVKIYTYRPERNPFSTWLFAIARNAITDHLRLQRRRQWVSMETLSDRPGDDCLPEEIVVRNEVHNLVRAAVANLPERDREVLALKFGAGLTNRAIAGVIRLSESNVGVILYRAVKRLRSVLSSEEIDL